MHPLGRIEQVWASIQFTFVDTANLHIIHKLQTQIKSTTLHRLKNIKKIATIWHQIFIQIKSPSTLHNPKCTKYNRKRNWPEARYAYLWHPESKAPWVQPTETELKPATLDPRCPHGKRANPHIPSDWHPPKAWREGPYCQSPRGIHMPPNAPPGHPSDQTQIPWIHPLETLILSLLIPSDPTPNYNL